MRTGLQLFLERVWQIFYLLLFHLHPHVPIFFPLNHFFLLYHHPLNVVNFFPLNLKVILVLVVLVALLAFHVEALCDFFIVRLDFLSDLVCLVFNLALIVFNDLHLLPYALDLQFLDLHLLFYFLQFSPNHRFFINQLCYYRFYF